MAPRPSNKLHIFRGTNIIGLIQRYAMVPRRCGRASAINSSFYWTTPIPLDTSIPFLADLAPRRGAPTIRADNNGPPAEP
jgi:hypothetical protein